jgi:hypothetical protein
VILGAVGGSRRTDRWPASAQGAEVGCGWDQRLARRLAAPLATIVRPPGECRQGRYGRPCVCTAGKCRQGRYGRPCVCTAGKRKQERYGKTCVRPAGESQTEHRDGGRQGRREQRKAQDHGRARAIRSPASEPRCAPSRRPPPSFILFLPSCLHAFLPACLRHCVTVSLCHCVTVSLCHCVTVSLCPCPSPLRPQGARALPEAPRVFEQASGSGGHRGSAPWADGVGSVEFSYLVHERLGPVVFLLTGDVRGDLVDLGLADREPAVAVLPREVPGPGE